MIRAQDPDGVILVGTRAWSSLGVSDGASETEVINNPVNATNIMYTFHFYAASHGGEYLNALSRAADQIPMFVTEFGTQTAPATARNNFTQSQAYLDLMASKKISWTNWNFSDDFRSGAVFTTGTCTAAVRRHRRPQARRRLGPRPHPHPRQLPHFLTPHPPAPNRYGEFRGGGGGGWWRLG